MVIGHSSHASEPLCDFYLHFMAPVVLQESRNDLGTPSLALAVPKTLNFLKFLFNYYY